MSLSLDITSECGINQLPRILLDVVDLHRTLRYNFGILAQTISSIQWPRVFLNNLTITVSTALEDSCRNEREKFQVGQAKGHPVVIGCQIPWTCVRSE